jgi:HPt (histidine-containing phosphotransfer) domain-containing protein
MSAPIDLPEVIRICDDRLNPAELLDVYRAQVAKDLAVMKAALRSGKYAEVRERAHSIKSASANLRAAQMKELSTKLEKQMATGQHSEAESMYRELENEFARIREFISEFMRKVGAPMKQLESLADLLDTRLPTRGTILELGSTGGQEFIYLARRFPHLTWQPSQADPRVRRGILDKLERSGLSNVRAPLDLDPSLEHGTPPKVEGILAHSLTPGLLERASAILSDDGHLFATLAEGPRPTTMSMRLRERLELDKERYLLVFERNGSSGQSGSTPRK